MANRITEKFKQLKSENCGGFIPFIVAGDPNLETTKNLILKLAEIGASVIELGVPFSDPVADGATIQASSERALRNFINVNDILKVVADIRDRGCETPVILFSYFNPILQFGLEKFADEAKKSGVDGVLITDLVPEEAKEFRGILSKQDLALIMLAAPTSSDERLQKICEKASGFVYAVSRAGVTGARIDSSDDAEKLVERLRKFTDLPIAVGFGISTREQVAEVWKYADAAVVGSAIVAEIIKLAPDAKEISTGLVEKTGDFARNLIP
ncbi:MAG: tryptophan synthase subunit alpha [Acidobacteriota bacterium]|jgi:tryptophan synthase alpha chain|nr:tryptophan synthase subunit alpha [Acidobacteriota bacterium]MDQ3374291.1 tryptophan synthase subunit alpha [Acidobacteriota bacterium]